MNIINFACQLITFDSFACKKSKTNSNSGRFNFYPGSRSWDPVVFKGKYKINKSELRFPVSLILNSFEVRFHSNSFYSIWLVVLFFSVSFTMTWFFKSCKLQARILRCILLASYMYLIPCCGLKWHYSFWRWRSCRCCCLLYLIICTFMAPRKSVNDKQISFLATLRPLVGVSLWSELSLQNP